MSETFGQVAERVRRRCALARAAELLERSAGPAAVSAAAAWLAWAAWGRGAFGVGWAAVSAVAWAGGLALWAWLRRPSAAGALALWDERAGRREAFLSAWCFERLSRTGAWEQWHLQRARARLAAELPALGRSFPLRPPLRAVAAGAVWLALAAVGWPSVSPDAAGAALSAVEREGARELATEIEEAAARTLERMGALVPEEEKAAQELRAQAAREAQRLRGEETRTPRDVLEALEALARRAEQLGEGLGAGEGELLSAAMIAEMEHHADTAELAGALRAGDRARAAEEAEKLAKGLDRDDLSRETRERVTEALERAQGAAQAEDARKVAGKAVRKAAAEMKQGQPRGAARAFRELADAYGREQRREDARRRLEQLAKTLRQSGHRVLQRTPRELQRLGRTPPAGPSERDRSYASPITLLPGARTAGIARGTRGPSRPPDSGVRVASGNGPVPGGSSAGTASGGAAGSGAPPVPGAGSGAGAQAGRAPVPGAGAAGAGAAAAGGPGGGVGGLEAGQGVAPMGGSATRPLTAKRDERLLGPPSGAGESDLRTVEGAEHQEAAARERQRVETELRRSEEEALHAEHLPVSRRDQLLWYFTELRRHLER